jgi:hypothetical protein
MRIKDFALVVHALVPKTIRNKRTVKEALLQGQWVSDFQGALTVPVLLQYLELFQELEQVVLQPEVPDMHIWRLSPTGKFSSKSAYMAMFQGSISFQLAERISKPWAPNKCKFFIWLVEHDRCWTADRLARRGLDCLEQCPLCDQQPETINHLLASCVFARQFWLVFCILWDCCSLCLSHRMRVLRSGGLPPHPWSRKSSRKGSTL